MFQKRENGAVDFAKNWQEYKHGFGSLSTEFWLGNEKLHRLSSMNQQLLVEFEDFNGEKAHASYQEFSILSEVEKYKLITSGYSGTAKDGLSIHNQKFTTIDQDNGLGLSNCAVKYRGGWWYQNCGPVVLNGPYVPSPRIGITWDKWKNRVHRLKRTTMKVRTLRGT